MAFFNIRGIIGTAIGGLIAWGVMTLAEAIGLQFSENVLGIYSASLMCLIAAFFGLTTDRCEKRGLWTSYCVNTAQFFSLAVPDPLDQGLPAWYDFNPHRCLAVLVLPLATFPLLPLLIGAGVWIWDAFSGFRIAPLAMHALYFGVNVGCVIVTLAYAAATAELRLRCPAPFSGGVDAAPDAFTETAPPLPEQPKLHPIDLTMVSAADEEIQMRLSFAEGYRWVAVGLAFVFAALLATWLGGAVEWLDVNVVIVSPFGLVAGVFLFFLTFQRIYVTEHRIERRWLGCRKTLDRRSTRVHKRRFNGFVLTDGHGTKMFIHRFVDNAEELYELIQAQGQQT